MVYLTKGFPFDERTNDRSVIFFFYPLYVRNSTLISLGQRETINKMVSTKWYNHEYTAFYKQWRSAHGWNAFERRLFRPELPWIFITVSTISTIQNAVTITTTVNSHMCIIFKVYWNLKNTILRFSSESNSCHKRIVANKAETRLMFLRVTAAMWLDALRQILCF